MQFTFAKRSSAADYLLLFMISAAASVLLTRFYLYLFDYPQLTRGNIHLAHIIYGGILLSMSNIVLLSLHGRRSRQVGAVLAGFGFGQFIDELGKFITRTNNYFFQPVPMIIYVCFIILFFIYRYLNEYTPLEPREVFYQVLEELEEVAEGKYFPATKKRLFFWIDRLKTDASPLYQNFAKALDIGAKEISITHTPKPRPYVQRIRSSWRWLDEFTTERQPVFYILLMIFLIYIGVTSYGIITFAVNLLARNYEKLQFQAYSAFDWFMIAGLFISQFWSTLLMVRGFLFLIRRKRDRALALFRNGLGVNILVTQLFTFYFEQFSAVIVLIFILALFAIVQNIIEDETE